MAYDILSEIDNNMARHDHYKRQLEEDAAASYEARNMAQADLTFIGVTGGMWEDWIRTMKTRNPHNNRIRVELDIITNQLQQFCGNWEKNPTGIVYEPSDDKTRDEDADLLNGIYRADFQDHGGKKATRKMLSEVAAVGCGGFVLSVEDDDEGDPENMGQHIKWHTKQSAFNMIFWDWNAREIDKSDAHHCTVLTPHSPESFQRKYPGKEPVNVFSPTMMHTSSSVYAARQPVFVATRYELVERSTRLHIYYNMMDDEVESYTDEDHAKIRDELAQDDTKIFQRTRNVKQTRVYGATFSGREILTPRKRLPGRHIPVISAYGFHDIISDMEHYKGLVRRFKDAQRVYNMQISQRMEDSASGSGRVPIFAKEQMVDQKMADQWADKRGSPFLLINPLRDEDGKIVQMGPLAYDEPPVVDQPSSELLQLAPDYVERQSGFNPGEAVRRDASGTALDRVIEVVNLNTQQMRENIQASIERSGVVYQSMAQDIYATHREIPTRAKDGSRGSTILMNAVMDEQTGTFVIANDLSRQRFTCSPDIGPSYDTKRAETVDQCNSLVEKLQSYPSAEEYIPFLVATIIDNIAGTGLEPLKKFNNRKMLLMGMRQPQTEEEIAMVQQAQDAARNDTSQQDMIRATVMQAMSEARNLDAASVEKLARKQLLEAQTAEVFAKIEEAREKLQMDGRKLDIDEMKIFSDARAKAREQLIKLPIQGQGNSQ